MHEQDRQKLPYESDNEAENRLWTALADLPQEEPSPQMRRSFYGRLDGLANRHWTKQLQRWLGFGNGRGWATAAACAVLGVFAGQWVDDAGPADSGRLATLEQNVAMLNRELILDRLDDATAGKRLRGVMDARLVAAGDDEIARALLIRATQDRVTAVRSAAIDALGPSLGSAGIGNELMKLLEDAESPIVQLALVDLVLRNGDQAQLQQLMRLAENEQIHPDLIRHVMSAVGGETV